ncbi:MAG TPA: hypothetical protein DHV16_10025 [Nitrospiraceae bacterium]|nr:hypothetical protein [Nitrospiraceae bacterium]HCZ12564.1 hypothetical protein [Nitrospiraceae bacterium]
MPAVTIKRYLALTEAEDDLLQKMLTNAVRIDFLMPDEYIALNALRKKLNLPGVDEIDDDFIATYSNCFKGCNL